MALFISKRRVPWPRHDGKTLGHLHLRPDTGHLRFIKQIIEKVGIELLLRLDLRAAPVGFCARTSGLREPSDIL